MQLQSDDWKETGRLGELGVESRVKDNFTERERD